MHIEVVAKVGVCSALYTLPIITQAEYNVQ